MLHLLHERGSHLVVTLLIAAAPIWCCCGMVLAETVALEAGNEPASCSTCPEQGEQPADQHPAPADNHDDCQCEHESVTLALPTHSSVKADPADTHVLVWVERVEPTLAMTVGGGVNRGPPPVLPAADSLLALHCLLTT